MISSTHKNDADFPSAVDVLGVPVVPFSSCEGALDCVTRIIERQHRSFWVAINPQKIHRAWHEPDLMDLLHYADVGFCDGVGVSLASRLLNGRGIARCTGCDLFFRLLGLSAEKGWGVFLLGASPESNAKASENLELEYPGLRIVGTQDGFFEDSAAVVEAINASGAELLFVAMGSPKQEYWIREHRDDLRPAFCMGVGGSINVASGMVARAPRIFQKTGTEFLYRVITEPSTRFRKSLAIIPYTLRTLRECFRRGRRPPKSV